MVLGLLAVFALLIFPTQALSAKPVKGITNPETPVPEVEPSGVCDYTDPNFAPDADNDGDGFTNQQECEGLFVDKGAAFDYPSCVVDSNSLRKDCLDPESKDLFVIFIPLPQESLIPVESDPLQYINLPQFDENGNVTGHLGITTHLVGGNTGLDPFFDRSVIPGQQKALRVTESKELTGNFGSSFDTNVPLLGKDDAKIYTYQIREFVNSQFANGGDYPEIWEEFILHTIAHEIGHGIKLYIEYNKRFDGWHLKPEYGKIMEEHIKVQDTVFFISNEFDITSVEGFQLVEAPL